MFLSLGVASVALVLATRGLSAQAAERKPNLVAFPAAPFSLAVVQSAGVISLRFATTSWNNGAGPLELRAGEVSADGQRKRSISVST